MMLSCSACVCVRVCVPGLIQTSSRHRKPFLIRNSTLPFRVIAFPVRPADREGEREGGRERGEEREKGREREGGR